MISSSPYFPWQSYSHDDHLRDVLYEGSNGARDIVELLSIHLCYLRREHSIDPRRNVSIGESVISSLRPAIHGRRLKRRASALLTYILLQN